MRRVALPFFALVVAALASPISVRAADPPSSSSLSADFDVLVKKGDLARIAGKWSEALKAYAAALEMKDEPLVAGRLGLVLIEFREYEKAAGKLFQAVEMAAGANDAERTRFFQAFLVAKKETCRVDVVVVQNGVKLELDGEPRFGGRREFWVFIGAGKHKLKATLDGFEDETVEVDATKGGQISIKVELHPVKPTEEIEKQAEMEKESPAVTNSSPEVKPAPVVREDKPTPSANSLKKNGSFVLGIGGGFVFGATPTPAVGPNIFGAWRSRTWWEVGVDARVAWTFVPDERFPETQFVTWSAMLVPCARARNRWFGCALLELDGVRRSEGTEGRLLPGIGLRGGLEFELIKALRLQIFGDAAMHLRGFRLETQDLHAAWTGSFVTGTIGVRAVLQP